MVEGRLSSHELICKHSDAPQVNSFVILLTLENLWSDVIASTAVCFASFITKSGPTEISQFTYMLKLMKIYICHDNILGLDIPVSNIPVLQVLYGLCQVSNLFSRILFWKFLELFQVVKQSSLLHKFQHQVNVCLVVEDTVYFQYERMVQVALKLYFQDELVDHFICLDDLFLDLFDCKNGSRSLVECHVGSAEPSLAKDFSDAKVINGKLLRWDLFLSAVIFHGYLNVFDVLYFSNFFGTLGRKIKTSVFFGFGIVLRWQNVATFIRVSIIILSLFDFRSVVFDIVFLGKVVFGFLFLNIGVTLDVGWRYLLLLCYFVIVPLFVDFPDLILDTIRALFI